MKNKLQYYGQIIILGKPNVGKSTLMNNIIGKKISIISRKKHTTQKNIIGIKTNQLHQFAYVDTPGVMYLKNSCKSLEQINLSKTINHSILIIFVIDCVFWDEYDQKVCNQIQNRNIPVLIVINKIDKLKNKNVLLPYIESLKKKINFKEIIPISAKKNYNIQILENIVKSYLPLHVHLYSKEFVTNSSQVFLISEIIREQLIFFLGDELPSIVRVKVEYIQQIKNKILFIRALIYVHNKRQKSIVIGKSGQKIKKISCMCRIKIEKYFCLKVHLYLWVKEKKLTVIK